MQKQDFQLTTIIDDLSKNGYAICNSFLPDHIIALLADEAYNRNLSGDMFLAKTGKNSIRHNANIRGDRICWLSEDSLEECIQEYFRQIYRLKNALNEQLFMNLHELETHLSLYPIGATYQKHLDQFQQIEKNPSQTRQLSCILYLSDNWRTADGGALRLYLNNDNHIDILPTAGKLVLFLSATFWHEVMPAKRDRMSLTGWFKTRSTRLI